MQRRYRFLARVMALLMLATLSTPVTAMDYDTIVGQMRERRWPELVAKFADTPLLEWPTEVTKQKVEALQIRAQARGVLKQGREGESDLLAATKLAPTSEVAWTALADHYANVMNDDARAIEKYRQVLAITGNSGSWATAHARISIARLLTDQVRTDEALQMLEQADFSKLATPWKIRTLRAFGHAYAAHGNETAALAKFREALELEQQQP